MLGTPRRRDLFLKVLEQVRQRYVLVVVGYVVMPEHIHLLLSEPQKKNLSVVMQALKLGFARRVLAGQRRRRNPSQGNLFEHGPQHVWQKRFYDFNVWTARKRAEKLRYMHENPVRRGLVASPELWRWSSYRAYFCGEPGPVAVNQWDVLKLKLRTPAWVAAPSPFSAASISEAKVDSKRAPPWDPVRRKGRSFRVSSQDAIMLVVVPQ